MHEASVAVMSKCVTYSHCLPYICNRFLGHHGICKKKWHLKQLAPLNAILIAYIQVKYLKCLKLTGWILLVPLPQMKARYILEQYKDKNIPISQYSEEKIG